MLRINFGSWLRRLAIVGAAMVMAGCGGGSGCANVFGNSCESVTAPGGGAATATASDLVLVLNSTSIANTGTESVTATVTALDAKRNVLANSEVTVSVDSDAIASPSGKLTDQSGVVTAAIGIGSNRTNRTITVTAVSGSLTRTAALQVSDGPTKLAPVAADLSLVLSSFTLNNGGTNTVLATVTAVDGNRNAVAGIPVAVRVDASALAVVSGAVTNGQGVVTAEVGIGADRSNRVVTVTATSGALTRQATFAVTGAKLSASLAPLVDTGSSGNQVEYTLLDTNANPMPGQVVSVVAPGLPTGAGVTNQNGKFTYTYTAPASAGTISISATGAGDSRSETVVVRTPGSGSVPDATAAPQSASVAPSPSVVSVNSVGSSTNQVELRALFIGLDNKPIQNIRVHFDLDGNANSSDGVVSWLGGSYAYSDANGVARGTFTPGQVSSPTNGVTIRACYGLSDFALGTCPAEVKTTLTVTSEALAVNIRTNELIKEGAAKLTYIKEFVVMVVDAAGHAKADVQITPSVDLSSYHKGFYLLVDPPGRWVQQLTLPASVSCDNEDINRNGVLEVGEDINGNGELDPRKSDVAVKMVGASRTDSSGLAIVQIEYGKSLATWVDFVITVTASGVSGTESRAKYAGLLFGVGNLPAPADAFKGDIAPAFVVSPYGKGAACVDPN